MARASVFAPQICDLINHTLSTVKAYGDGFKEDALPNAVREKLARLKVVNEPEAGAAKETKADLVTKLEYLGFLYK